MNLKDLLHATDTELFRLNSTNSQYKQNECDDEALAALESLRFMSTPPLSPKFQTTIFCYLDKITQWEAFHSRENEMIVTKSGRCLFPILSFSITGLNPNNDYLPILKLKNTCGNRYRWKNGSWRIREEAPHCLQIQFMPKPKAEKGRVWMENGIDFKSAKLTNTPAGKRMLNNKEIELSLYPCVDKFNVTSFYRYAFDLILLDCVTKLTRTFKFNVTEFTVVTHYQNDKVNNLKKLWNPHARTNSVM